MPRATMEGCSRCKQPVSGNYRLCAACRETARAAYQRRKQARRAQNLCRACAQNPPEPNLDVCGTCRLKANAKAAAAWHAKQATDTCSQCGSPTDGGYCVSCREAARDYYHRAVAAKHQGLVATGTCPRCKQRPSADGVQRCAECREQHREASLTWGRKRTTSRRRQGKCVYCGQQPYMSGHAEHKMPHCETCYLSRMAQNYLGDSARASELLAVLEQQNYRCAYTGEVMELGVNASLEHRFPVSRFPERACDISNMEWVLWKVNEMKRDRTPDEFLDDIRTILNYQEALKHAS